MAAYKTVEQLIESLDGASEEERKVILSKVGLANALFRGAASKDVSTFQKEQRAKVKESA